MTERSREVQPTRQAGAAERQRGGRAYDGNACRGRPVRGGAAGVPAWAAGRGPGGRRAAGGDPTDTAAGGHDTGNQDRWYWRQTRRQGRQTSTGSWTDGLTSSTLLCCVVEWAVAEMACAGHGYKQGLQHAEYGGEGQAGAGAFGSRRSRVHNAWASTARVTWRCQPT